MGGSLTTHTPTNDNPSDLMAKILTGQKTQKHVGNILYDIYHEHYQYLYKIILIDKQDNCYGGQHIPIEGTEKLWS